MSYSTPAPFLYKACVLCKRTVLHSDPQDEEKERIIRNIILSKLNATYWHWVYIYTEE